MKNLSTAEMQDVNGGGWIADWVESVLCEYECTSLDTSYHWPYHG